jgi:hypothetical protein
MPKGERLCLCPHCGSARYMWLDRPSVLDRKAICLATGCGKYFGKLDGRKAKHAKGGVA